MDIASLRAALPLVQRTAYLNAGSVGPVPISAFEAARLALEMELRDGRSGAHVRLRSELCERLRIGWARVIGCDPSHLILASSTREALARVLNGLRLGRGAEIVTSTSEHPALEEPLRLAAARGARVRAVPLSEVANAVRAGTTLVACSHVAWDSGEKAPETLAELDVPVILDGAQAAGAVPVNVAALGCAAYAAPGQKWLCGAEGTAMLFIHPELLEQLPTVYLCRDSGESSRVTMALSLAALEFLETMGLEQLQRRAMKGAAMLAARLRESGMRVTERNESTLVAWSDRDPERSYKNLEAHSVIVKPMADRALVRASVGGWTTDDDLDRLLNALRKSKSPGYRGH